MSITGAMKEAGYKPEVSTVGDKPILKGVYKVMFVEGKKNAPNQYGESYTAKFKVVEVLAGKESRSTFPEFVGFFAIDEANAMNAKKGIKKLLNGFMSVGIKIDISSDEAMFESLASQVGVAELYVSGYKKKSWTKLDDGSFVENPDADPKQDFAFLTEKNAKKEAEKSNGHPL